MALAPASFRGVQFAVTQTDFIGGRRQALHQYPGKDTPWAEDMGRAARRFRLRGFVLDGSVKLGGSSIAMQRSQLIAACEKKGRERSSILRWVRLPSRFSRSRSAKASTLRTIRRSHSNALRRVNRPFPQFRARSRPPTPRRRMASS
jgi:hypothetical protein